MSDFLEQMAFCPVRRTWTRPRTLRAKEPTAARVTSNDRSASCCCKLSALCRTHTLLSHAWMKEMESKVGGRRWSLTSLEGAMADVVVVLSADSAIAYLSVYAGA